MMVQIELTTRCNFDCFYCAGRHMRQADMAYQEFVQVLERHIARYGIPESVSLQGEGEPTLHPDFFRMAQHVVSLGATPYTITNGTYRHPAHFAESFSRVGVSVDTLDPAAAEKVGRRNLARVLQFVTSLAAHVEVVIHSVAHREHTAKVASWCSQNEYRHVVQPLQTKPDFAIHYAKHWKAPAPRGAFSCKYLSAPRMRYYSLDSLEMPCCFIKDTSAYGGIEVMQAHQGAGSWPSVCVGCRHAASET